MGPVTSENERAKVYEVTVVNLLQNIGPMYLLEHATSRQRGRVGDRLEANGFDVRNSLL